MIHRRRRTHGITNELVHEHRTFLSGVNRQRVWSESEVSIHRAVLVRFLTKTDFKQRQQALKTEIIKQLMITILLQLQELVHMYLLMYRDLERHYAQTEFHKNQSCHC